MENFTNMQVKNDEADFACHLNEVDTESSICNSIGSCISNKNLFFGCGQCPNIFSSVRMLEGHINLVHGKKDAIVDKVQFLETSKTNIFKVEPPDVDDLDECIFSFQGTVKNEPTQFQTGSVKVDSNDGTNKWINENTEASSKKRDIFIKLEQPDIDPEVSFASSSASSEYSNAYADESTPTLVSYEETIKIEPTLIETGKVDSNKLFNENVDANQVVETGNGDVSYNKGKFECKTCYQLFDKKKELKCHARIHEKPHSCETCSKSFRCAFNLKSHMRIHSQERPFSCESCGESFKTYGTMKLHMKIHLTYSCTICHRNFVISSKLKDHMRTHSDGKPHSCEICDKRFRCTFNLKRHMVTHSNERPFSCETCAKSFKTNYILKEHLGIHSTDRPFSCTKCNKNYKSLRILNKHKKLCKHILDPASSIFVKADYSEPLDNISGLPCTSK